MREIKVGDWVRFYQGGRLVVGIVQYVQPRIDRQDYVQTDIGAIKESYVLEVRRDAEQ